MRVFLAGATGAIGRPLVRALLAGGHEVTGMTRSADRAEELRAAGATPVIADALDAVGLRAAVVGASPDAVIHELTSIPARLNPRRIQRQFELTNRLRTEGTGNLIAAAREAGAQRLIAQSIAFMYAPGPTGTVHHEQDPLLDPEATPGSFRAVAAAVHTLESRVGEAGGIVLRYGYFYGPGTGLGTGGSIVEDVRRRRLPIVGDGAGAWSFIHVDDAASATVAALEHPAPGVYNVVDDEPAAARDWIPALAEVLGAPKPLRVPALLARPLAGRYGVETMTRAQGASNARARRDLSWTSRYHTWREGFRTGLG